jgi:hypothetical protein
MNGMRTSRLAAALVGAGLAVLGLVAPAGSGIASAAPSPSPALPKFVVQADGASLLVRDAATGAVVARISVPFMPNTYVGALTTTNGTDYLLAMTRPGICRSWLYTFSP